MSCIFKASRLSAIQRPASSRVVPFTPVRHVSRPSQRQGRAVRNVRANFFKFGGETGETAGIYGSQGKDDYDADDLEQYFNYMGFLAEEGTYDRMYALTKSGLSPVDSILMLAASENDFPKIQEILKAGANPLAKDVEGRIPREIATKDDVKSLLQEYESKAAAV